MGVGETITVINKSGKVVSNSKHIVSIFKEAKASYRERKAELKAERDAAARERKLMESLQTLRIDDDTQSRAPHRSRSQRHHDRPTIQRGYTDSQVGREVAHRGSNTHVARNTTRSHDDDLCYGDVPPPLAEPRYDDGELQEKACKITMLLEEANCLQYSASTAIESLQRNPEALAAVSLTLAEISALVAKMGPGVLTTLKGSFPAVAALLLSPQFLIAGGVAVGVTIVALGGYKIIKKIQADQEAVKNAGPVPVTLPVMDRSPVQYIEAPIDLNDLDELQPQELSRVEKWRRGIADVEAESGGTTVDGEFVTPGASKQLVAAGVLDEDDLKSRRSTRIREDGERKRSHRARSEKSVRSEKPGRGRGEKTGHTSKHKSSETRSKSRERRKSKSPKEGTTKKKEKEPSGLRMLFRSHTTA